MYNLSGPFLTLYHNMLFALVIKAGEEKHFACLFICIYVYMYICTYTLYMYCYIHISYSNSQKKFRDTGKGWPL